MKEGELSSSNTAEVDILISAANFSGAELPGSAVVILAEWECVDSSHPIKRDGRKQ